MTLDTDVLDRDLQYIAADFPATFTWKNPSKTVETITDAIAGQVERENDVEDEGVFENFNLRVALRIQAFASSTVLPKVQDVCTVDDEEYFVESKSRSADKVMLLLDLRQIEE